MSDSASTQPPSDYRPDLSSPLDRKNISEHSHGEDRSVPSENAFVSKTSAPISIALHHQTQADTLGNSRAPALTYFQNTSESMNKLLPLMNSASQTTRIPLLGSLTTIMLPNAGVPSHPQAPSPVSFQTELDSTPIESNRVLSASHSQDLNSATADRTRVLSFASRLSPPSHSQVRELQRLRRLRRTAILRGVRERNKARARSSRDEKSAPPHMSLRKRVQKEAPRISNGHNQKRPRKRKLNEVGNGEGAHKQVCRRKQKDGTPKTKSKESKLGTTSTSPMRDKSSIKETAALSQNCPREGSVDGDKEDEFALKCKLRLDEGVQKLKLGKESSAPEQEAETSSDARVSAIKTSTRPPLGKECVRNATDLCEPPSSMPAVKEHSGGQLSAVKSTKTVLQVKRLPRQDSAEEMSTQADQISPCQRASGNRVIEGPSGAMNGSLLKSLFMDTTTDHTKKVRQSKISSREENQPQDTIDEVVPNPSFSLVESARETAIVPKVSQHKTTEVLSITKTAAVRKSNPKTQQKKPVMQESGSKDRNRSEQKIQDHETAEQFAKDFATPAPTRNSVRQKRKSGRVKNLEKQRIAELEKQVMQLRWELLKVSKPGKTSENLAPSQTNATKCVKFFPSDAIAIANITECWSKIDTAYPPWEIRSEFPSGAYTRGQLSLQRLFDHVTESIQKGIDPPSDATFKSLQCGIISNLTAAGKADFAHTPRHATVIFTISKMTQTFLNSVFSLFLQAPSTVDMCWSVAVVEYIVVPLLQYSKSESEIVYSDVAKSCVKAVCDSALALSPEEDRSRQAQVELNVRAFEMCMAILDTEDEHVLSQIPENTVCALGSRNILFSLRYAALKSK